MVKKVLVIGFGGKSGLSAVNFLLKQNYEVIANDKRKEEELEQYISKVTNRDKVQFALGHHDITDKLNDISMVVISPGVPSDISVIKKAKENNIPVISEVELAFRHHSKNWIGITGTDGKSTTTSLIGDIVKLKYPDTLIGGNLGTPLTGIIGQADKDTFVVSELSSFQLENIVSLRPLVGVLINIAGDHLDRYNSFDDYVRAKFNLFNNQVDSDYSVFNGENGVIFDWIQKSPVVSRKYYFSLHKKKGSSAYFEKNYFVWKDGNGKENVFKNGEQQIVGEHNKENILAAIAAAKLLKIENEYIREGIRNFKGLPHRMEFIRDLNGRHFYNDSKATTPSAVRMSIASFKNVILIMGGRDKGLDYSLLNTELKKRVNHLVLTGEARMKIKSMIKYSEKKMILSGDFNGAVKNAYEISKKGDNIILSPGCASYDVFNNFEERGEAFRRIVNGLS